MMSGSTYLFASPFAIGIRVPSNTALHCAASNAAPALAGKDADDGNEFAIGDAAACHFYLFRRNGLPDRIVAHSCLCGSESCALPVVSIIASPVGLCSSDLNMCMGNIGKHANGKRDAPYG